MRGGKNKHLLQGYTIVEVMIVLAVSGVMFLIAASFINGKQEKAAFTQGTNETGSSLQKIVEEVTDGHYSDIPLTCNVSSSPPVIKAASGGGEQGETSDCVFLGKIVCFGCVFSATRLYSVISIGAARDITDFPSDKVASISGLTTLASISQNLKATDVTIVDGGSGAPPVDPDTVHNIGFLQGLGNPGEPGVYISSAQQPVQLVYADIGNIASFSGTNIRPAKSATICLTDGTRYAQVLVGGAISGGGSKSNNNNQLNISVKQLGTTAC